MVPSIYVEDIQLFVKYPTEYQLVIKNHSLYWGLIGNIFYIVVLYYMVKVIAEIGINHNGSMEECKKIIMLVKVAGK